MKLLREIMRRKWGKGKEVEFGKEQRERETQSPTLKDGFQLQSEQKWTHLCLSKPFSKCLKTETDWLNKEFSKYENSDSFCSHKHCLACKSYRTSKARAKYKSLFLHRALLNPYLLPYSSQLSGKPGRKWKTPWYLPPQKEKRKKKSWEDSQHSQSSPYFYTAVFHPGREEDSQCTGISGPS